MFSSILFTGGSSSPRGRYPSSYIVSPHCSIHNTTDGTTLASLDHGLVRVVKQTKNAENIRAEPHILHGMHGTRQEDPETCSLLFPTILLEHVMISAGGYFCTKKMQCPAAITGMGGLVWMVEG